MPAALVIAHPGHELRVYGWMTLEEPLVFVLTDGSGDTGQSRLATTRRILDETGTPAATVFGRFTDRELYEAVLERKFDLLIALTEEIAQQFDAAGVDVVAADGIEGYSPSHDVCRLITNAAIARTGRRIRNYDFPLTGRPNRWRTPDAKVVRLDEARLQRKLEAARRYSELAAEVDAALRDYGIEAFREEVLRPAPHAVASDGLPDTKPFYEVHGEQRVAEGKYDLVLSRREHVLPLAEALWRSLP